MRKKVLNPGQTRDVDEEHDHLVAVQLKLIFFDIDSLPKVENLSFYHLADSLKNFELLERSYSFFSRIIELSQSVKCCDVWFLWSIHSGSYFSQGQLIFFDDHPEILVIMLIDRWIIRHMFITTSYISVF